MSHFQLGYINENTNFYIYGGVLLVYYKVKKGDNLSKISKQFYGSTKYVKKIFEQNKNHIGSNPDLIKIGVYIELHNYDNKLIGYVRSKGFEPNLKLVPFLETPTPLVKSNEVSFSNVSTIKAESLALNQRNEKKSPPIGTDNVTSTLKMTSEVNTVTNSIFSSIAKNSGNSMVGSNTKIYFAKNSARAFYGNQYVSTKSLAGYGKASKFLGPAGYAISVGQIGYGIYQDDGEFGYNAQKATGGAVGSMAGGYVGAKAGAALGAAIGALFVGVGAVPGAIIGGIIGGIAGSYYGGKVGEAVVNHYHE